MLNSIFDISHTLKDLHKSRMPVRSVTLKVGLGSVIEHNLAVLTNPSDYTIKFVKIQVLEFINNHKVIMSRTLRKEVDQLDSFLIFRGRHRVFQIPYQYIENICFTMSYKESGKEMICRRVFQEGNQSLCSD